VTLLFPKKAIVANHCTPLLNVLGDNGVKVFKNIFDNNNQALRDQFFKHPFIRTLWPLLRDKYRYEHCFCKAGPNPDLVSTYKMIIETLQTYKMETPMWWKTLFSSKFE
jgi:hypothetical protein